MNSQTELNESDQSHRRESKPFPSIPDTQLDVSPMQRGDFPLKNQVDEPTEEFSELPKESPNKVSCLILKLIAIRNLKHQIQVRAWFKSRTRKVSTKM